MTEALELLLQDAGHGLTVSCHAVATWRIPGFYMDAEGHLEAKRLMEPDAQAAYAAALAYRYTGKTAYAEKAVEMIDGWAAINQEFTENDGPLVSAYLGVGLIRAAIWIKDYPGWEQKARERFTRWITDICLPAWAGIPGRNNWWNWSLYAQAAFYHFADDNANLKRITAELKTHIGNSISAEGFIPEEAERGQNGMWYHYFALAPLTAAAYLVQEAIGEDLFHYTSSDGKSIKLALDALFRYVDGRVEEWPFTPDQNFPELAVDTWPVELYDAMAVIYQDAEYERFAAPYRPVVGNRNSGSGYYLSYAWIYPSLILD
ncbi:MULTISPECIES: alginate lyase family protein [Paenibacillus]|uniref:alginate lyase family protein n=1 Tax=Paenibacillus TaxID=44249 RepID=UPI00096D7C59|nr:alginate lyase family protein [Paenibacillus odorifer]OME09992.1 hypothetical protein BSK60_26460 [Paenibacillus odorifer]